MVTAPLYLQHNWQGQSEAERSESDFIRFGSSEAEQSVLQLCESRNTWPVLSSYEQQRLID
jgi:hypothetical protein